MAAIQAALRDDCEIVRAYGEAHSETWVGLRFDNEPTVRVVAVFAGELSVHDGQLRHLVARPGRLVLEACLYTHADLQATRAEIDGLIAQRAAETGRWVIFSIGEGVGVIHVRLRADQEDFAAQLAKRFGSAVDLQVGEFSFPDRRRPILQVVSIVTVPARGHRAPAARVQIARAVITCRLPEPPSYSPKCAARRCRPGGWPGSPLRPVSA